MGNPHFQAMFSKLSALNTPENAAKIQALAKGGSDLATGSAQLKAGTAELASKTANDSDLITGIKALDAGATKLAAGTKATSKGASDLDTGITSLSGATDQLYEKAGEIAGGASSVNSGAAQLSSGANDLNSGAQKLNSGANDVNSGVAKLNSGAADLNSGVATLSDGANTLNKGAGDLNNGAGTLKDGMSKLNDGITTAQNGVNDAITDANGQITKLDGLADYASAPVSVDQKSLTTIPNYGTAFAPYFMSLSLWVGALILFVGIYLDTEGRFKIMSRESEHKAVRAFLFQLIAFCQAIALGIVVKNGLGLDVANVPLYYFSIVLVSMSFMSIVQFLMIHLKSAGKLLTIILLILQLTSCGGTFPMELIPKFYGYLYPYMPMTYSVALFKQAITDPHKDAVVHNCVILGIILVVFMALTLVLSLVKFKKETAEQANVTVQYES
jgi:putative membrane protein